MMSLQKERLYIYDTTLRDGQQTQGVQFSTDEKIEIADLLGDLGVDYIEGGWPGANPTDTTFFETYRTNANLVAFGMTKRSGRSAENDDVLASVLNAGTKKICLVGKTHDCATLLAHSRNTLFPITLLSNLCNWIVSDLQEN